ncbi:TetR/AcrR family transcriptional regulator [Lutispora saccharofermentans]|uniref:TetR/AcrR family transcriptional regulator n=1 Tax=Lutispora saccharofermentans TaxID=3024236 RepID=A0ABT1NGV4_9FIRM|nr:TetR/AcrR family transcriptional regulator [Lutispora saccharofermentans]MCQ1530513.1 TetR/AcrR family transcriptional regulator [Lutispora saccharofermentans]
MSEKKDIIYNCGKEIFEKKGFKDTNVAEIMKQAGMATGTFYSYYNSKDKLFMEIYNDENAKLKRRILASLNMEAEPILVMKEMMMKNLQGMQENPILREWYNRDVFQKLEKGFREEDGAERVDFLYDSFVEVVRKWQNEGKMRSDISAEMIMAIFAALVNVDTHKEEIGLEYFPQVIEYLAEFTMKGLMINENKNEAKEEV